VGFTIAIVDLPLLFISALLGPVYNHRIGPRITLQIHKSMHF
jgi:hypothetical protein